VKGDAGAQEGYAANWIGLSVKYIPGHNPDLVIYEGGVEQERINLLTIPMGAKRSPDVDDIYNLLMSKGFQMSLEEAQSSPGPAISGSRRGRVQPCPPTAREETPLPTLGGEGGGDGNRRVMRGQERGLREVGGCGRVRGERRLHEHQLPKELRVRHGANRPANTSAQNSRSVSHCSVGRAHLIQPIPPRPSLSPRHPGSSRQLPTTTPLPLPRPSPLPLLPL